MVDLMTHEGENLQGQPWQAYPRPQMRRNSFVNLNGEWELAVGDGEFDKKILVPFCPESQLSGLQEHFDHNQPLKYRRAFDAPDLFDGGRVLLHFGAVDSSAEVFLNGQFVAEHIGGYDAFVVDITDRLKEENELLVVSMDAMYNIQPYGKQTLKRGGMWYTPVSGIWQTVWLESVPETYIRKLNIENRGASVTISTEPALEGKVTVSGLGEFALTHGKVTITPENPRFWSPEDPYLYDFVVEAGEDRVESYFALRTLEIRKIGGYQRLCLNGKPYFFHGLLDQGYWPDGLFTPAAPACYANDILAMKRLGFNTLRKHIKVEPEEFYYQCDKLGMIVFQDMVNNGDYNFLRDTALPTIGIQKLNDKQLHRDPVTREAFLRGMETTVNQLKNHPCILYWTIFNEGWGQFDSDSVYHRLRALDDTRWIDSTSGWFRRRETDVDSRHVYFRPVKLKPGEKPLVLSEFGGYSYKPEGHVFNTEQTYGYKKFAHGDEFAAAVEKLYCNEIIPAAKKGLCAAVYTQVSDVEDETNGLLSYDRKVEKLTPETMLPIVQALQAAVEEK